MKKSIFILFCILFVTNLFAQIDEDELHQGMERLQQDMNELIKNLEEDLGETQIFMDTLVFQGFGGFSPKGFLDIHPDSLQMDGLFDQLQEQFQDIPEEDWAQFRSLMRNFGLELPQETPLNEDPKAIPPKKKAKKRKQYTL